MKKSYFITVLILAFGACDTPSQIKGKPDGAFNTTGTTGSTNNNNSDNMAADVRNPAGTPKDTAIIKKDSLPE